MYGFSRTPCGMPRQTGMRPQARRTSPAEERLGFETAVTGVVPERLRVLVANEREDRIDRVRAVVEALGHTVIVTSTDVAAVAQLTSDARPDVALVGLGADSAHALELIEQIVQEAACPVIALLVGQDPSFVSEAAKRGVFAYLADGDAEELQSALGIVLRRFAEYHNLEGAFARRAVTERAKGILMERHQIDEAAAFDRLRNHARRSGHRLVDVAQAVCDSHTLLTADTGPHPGGASDGQ
jgi:AmiR/NasT family two-component response regulator